MYLQVLEERQRVRSSVHSFSLVRIRIACKSASIVAEAFHHLFQKQFVTVRLPDLEVSFAQTKWPSRSRTLQEPAACRAVRTGTVLLCVKEGTNDSLCAFDRRNSGFYHAVDCKSARPPLSLLHHTSHPLAQPAQPASRAVLSVIRISLSLTFSLFLALRIRTASLLKNGHHDATSSSLGKACAATGSDSAPVGCSAPDDPKM